MENEGGSESVLDSLGVDSPIPEQKTGLVPWNSSIDIK